MRRWIFPAVISLFAAGALAAATAKVPPRYKDWIRGPVSLLITHNERSEFQRLSTDAERDAFIDRFWRIRNPHPGSLDNEFKDDFYRRVAWANAHFGADSGTSDGWRTDMGRAWVLFGKPRQVRDYLQGGQLKPIQLWFYSNPGLAELPPFFYVLFYEKDDVSGFRLYIPYVDGPRSLVRAGADNQQAYNTMHQISAELAQASLTLIPGEPPDIDTYSGSMASSTIVDAIEGYRDMPSYVAKINERSAQLASVRTRIHYDLPQAALETLVASDRGRPWLHWQLEINDPLHLEQAGKVALRIHSQLFAGDRLVFERTDAPSVTAPENSLKNRSFVYEDRMPVVPGQYRLVVEAENETGRRYRAAKEFQVAAPADRAVLSDVLVVAGHAPDPRVRPFSFAGVKFEPSPGGRVEASRGLDILYEIQLPEPRPAELKVSYVIGNLTTRLRKTYEDTLDPRQANAFGELVTAKALKIEDLPAGPYRLAVQVKDPATGKISAQSAQFVVENEPPAAPVVIARGTPAAAEVDAADDYARALCWLAQDRPRQAVPLLEASYKASGNPAVGGLLKHLYERIGQASRLPNVSQPTRGGNKQ